MKVQNGKKIKIRATEVVEKWGHIDRTPNGERLQEMRMSNIIFFVLLKPM